MTSLTTEPRTFPAIVYTTIQVACPDCHTIRDLGATVYDLGTRRERAMIDHLDDNERVKCPGCLWRATDGSGREMPAYYDASDIPDMDALRTQAVERARTEQEAKQ